MITARDYTGLRDRPKKLWTVGDIALPKGVLIPALLAGGGAGIATLVVAVNLVGGMWAVVSAVLVCVLVYGAWGKNLPSRMSVLQAAVVWADYYLRQPKTIHGFTKAQEPDFIEWRVILWEPVDPGWIAHYQHTTRWLRLALSRGSRRDDATETDRAA